MNKMAKAPKASLLDKEPTAMHEAYADWIKKQTGYDVDTRSIQLGTLLRGEYQKSDVNQNLMAARREQREADAQKREEARAAREAAKAAKAEKAAARKTAAKKAPAKKAAKKTAAGPKRRPASAKK